MANSQLEAMLQAAVDAALKPVISRLEEMERDHKCQARALAQAIGRSQDPKNQLPDDKLWECLKCKARIGFYDETRDVLRTSHDGHIVHVRIGVGGYISVVCRECGEVNTLDYQPPAGQPSVQNGILEMSVSALEKLMEQAKASPDQTIQIPLDVP